MWSTYLGSGSLEEKAAHRLSHRSRSAVAMVTTGEVGGQRRRAEEAETGTRLVSPLRPSARTDFHRLVLVLPTPDREVLLHQNTL